MKLRILIGAVGLLCAMSVASAADLPAPIGITKPVAYMTAPVTHRWSGFYLGVNGAYGMPSSYDTTSSGGGSAIFKDAFKSSPGYLYGVTFGANYQMGQWVAGLEGDFDLASGFNANRSSKNCLDPACIIKSRFDENERLLWLGTFRGRLGHLFFGDKVLVYGTGGLAVGGFKDTQTFWCTVCARTSTATTSFGAGWIVGAGVEVALAEHWTAKVEYDYVDLSRQSMTTNIATIGTFKNSSHFADNLVKVGLNYSF